MEKIYMGFYRRCETFSLARAHPVVDKKKVRRYDQPIIRVHVRYVCIASVVAGEETPQDVVVGTSKSDDNRASGAFAEKAPPRLPEGSRTLDEGIAPSHAHARPSRTVVRGAVHRDEAFRLSRPSVPKSQLFEVAISTLPAGSVPVRQRGRFLSK
jgi:hypothetical protein